MGMEIVKQLPLLMDETKLGKTKYWEVWVTKEDDKAYTIARSWTGEGGKVQEFPKEVKGKNIGKANETTPLEQAEKNATSMWKKKKKSGYHEDGEEVQGVHPMLAKKFEDIKPEKLTWPAYIQPKLDGIRATYKEEEAFYSRKLTEFQNISFAFQTDDYRLDGELMLPLDEFTFQQTVSAVTKEGNENNAQLIYYVYDVIVDELTFEERYKILQDVVKLNKDNVNIELVKAIEVEDEAAFKEQAATFIEQGYEGAMYRSKEGKYLQKHRSKHLLKYKLFEDAEYVIVDVVPGTGKNKTLGTWVLKTYDKEGFETTFKANSTGVRVQREEYLTNKDSYIGKKLTVKYQELTDKGVPRFPQGIAIRDYE